MENRIIVIDDERDFLESIRRGLLISGFREIKLESDPQKAAGLFEDGAIFDIALIDITMPKMSGLEVLEKIKTCSPQTECIMITAIDEATTAVNAMKKGAYDYLLKPVEKDELVLSINRALERRRLYNILDLGKGDRYPEIENEAAFADIIAGSSEMLKILKEAELHAMSDVPILITGESGTGKELLAKAVHRVSARSKYAFTPVNMAALTPTLFDSEFFGHTKGAFTGADKDRAGFLEFTNKGSLFLDEIGTMPMELQGKLLRVLQDGEYIKIGTDRPGKVDIRFISATNENLENLVHQKKFRSDLYYRLKGGWIHLPPLKKRKEDIPLLVRHFIGEICGSSEMRCGIETKAMSLLLRYDYPGNVRELESIINSAANLSRKKTITEKHLPDHIKKLKDKKALSVLSDDESVVALADVEKKHILKVYEKTGKNKSQTARLLGIGLNTLRRKLDAYG